MDVCLSSLNKGDKGRNSSYVIKTGLCLAQSSNSVLCFCFVFYCVYFILLYILFTQSMSD